MQYTVKKSSTIHLGKQGEHRSRELVLPELAAWEKEHGPGEAEILFLPPGKKTPFSITPARTEDGVWLWSVTAAETACPGYGKCELRYAAGGAVVKSATYQTYVAESLGDGVSAPETDPDSAQREESAGMPLLIDEESGIPYALIVEGGRLMIQEGRIMAAGDKKPVVMEYDRAAPGGVATLDKGGKLAEGQRPDYAINQVTGLQHALDAKQDKIMAVGLLKGDGNGTVTAAKPGKDYGLPVLAGPEDPAGSTKGAVGQHYLNTTTGREYSCVAADDGAGVYTWKESGGSGSGGGGSIITITFDPEFAGREFTVSDGTDTVTGIVPEGLAASVNVINTGSTYTITAEADGQEYSSTVTTGPYFGKYSSILKFGCTYGVRWSGGPETTWSRTDDAAGFTNPVPYVNGGPNPSSPFDHLYPWSGMVRYEDGALGSLVAIPKYWYKWTKSGTVMTLQISDKKQNGFFVSPAHADRDDGQGERDVVYVGRYHCGDNYKSTSGVLPKVSITRAAARSAISALDAAAWQYDFAMYWTIAMLYLVEFADWNVQKAIGCGCGNNSSTQTCGASDNMNYHTGTMQSSRSVYGVGCQYRHIEGLWDNCLDFVDGIYFSGANIYCIKDPSKFSDTANGTLTGTRPTSANYIKTWGIPTASGFAWALYPLEAGGSENTYVSDYCNYTSSSIALSAGGYSTQNQTGGLFCLNGSADVSSYGRSIGCRLMKLPNKEEG